MNTPVRVGIIRCDTHAMWFGAQMQEHDSVLLERPVLCEEGQEAKYSWMTRGVHYFYYTIYRSPRRMTAPRVEGFEITRVWDEDPDVAELFARVFHGKPKVCDDYQQVSDDVDLVFVADCNGDGADHARLAAPGLEKSVATFIDKPLAHCSSDVRIIRNAADQSGAPVMSLSILQTNPATARFARQMEGLGPIGFGAVTCASRHPAALIHAISIVHHVFGVGIETAACLRTAEHTAVHLGYGGRPNRPSHGVVIHVGVADFRFTEMFISAYGPEGALQGAAMSDFNASEGSALILEHVKEMVRTRKPHPLGDEMVAAVAVMDAIREAEATGRAVAVSEAG